MTTDKISLTDQMNKDKKLFEYDITKDPPVDSGEEQTPKPTNQTNQVIAASNKINNQNEFEFMNTPLSNKDVVKKLSLLCLNKIANTEDDNKLRILQDYYYKLFCWPN